MRANDKASRAFGPDALHEALELRASAPSAGLIERTWQRIRAERNGADSDEVRADETRHDPGAASAVAAPAPVTRGRPPESSEPVWSWLTADSWFPLPSLRAMAPLPAIAVPRVLVFETTRYLLSVTLNSAVEIGDGQPALRGQLLPKEGDTLPPARVTLETPDGDLGPATPVDAVGGFHFARRGLFGAMRVQVGDDTFRAGPIPNAR